MYLVTHQSHFTQQNPPSEKHINQTEFSEHSSSSAVSHLILHKQSWEFIKLLKIELKFNKKWINQDNMPSCSIAVMWPYTSVTENNNLNSGFEEQILIPPPPAEVGKSWLSNVRWSMTGAGCCHAGGRFASSLWKQQLSRACWNCLPCKGQDILISLTSSVNTENKQLSKKQCIFNNEIFFAGTELHRLGCRDAINLVCC